MTSKPTGKKKSQATPERGAAGDGASEASRANSNAHNPQATRETVESVVVAVILAFLFRAFIAEAFVIPTGSMAPTLYGRNKDIVCFQCSHPFATGASKEVPRSFDGEVNRHGVFNGPKSVSAAHCPICRVATRIKYRNVNDSRPLPASEVNVNHTSFSGDRILVSKFSYAMAEPNRWEVIVFKYPGNAKQNYIKRLIGLPDEAVMIEFGNIYTANLLFRKNRDVFQNPLQGPAAIRQFFADNGVNLSESIEIRPVNGSISMSTLIEDGNKTYALTHNYLTNNVSVYGDRFVIQRKPPHKVVAMLQIVDDTDYVGEVLKTANWPARWQDWTGKNEWIPTSDAFRTGETTGEQIAWLRYRHLPPTDADWDLLMNGEVPNDLASRPGRLIDDYYAYNDGEFETTDGRVLRDRGPTHWVGDLAVECNVNVEGDQGAIWLDLVEGGAHYQCRIDVATGEAELSIAKGEEGFTDSEGKIVPTVRGSTSVRTGSYRLRFANVDDQLVLWVNDHVVQFDGPTTYQTREDVTPSWSGADAGDAEPTGVGSEGGLALEITNLRVWRDIYYVATTDSNDEYVAREDLNEIHRIMSTPSEWGQTQLFARRKEAVFGLEKDDFFPLGDNSPESKDARMWDDERYVNREFMIGKAVLIYWPHPWQLRIPFTSTSLPILPNFGRMRLIR